MDGPGADLTRFAAALAPFDDEALAALASKGLVRRARKDLEAARPTPLGVVGERLRLAVEDAEVAIALPPAGSTCSCPSPGICRHILAALVHLRESNGPGETAPPVATAADEILGVDDEALTRWAGKPLVNRALKSLALGLAAEFDEAGGALLTRFPARNVTCRWMPGGGLAGMVCSCHAEGSCEHRVAAILAFQVARGVRALDLVAQAATGPAGEAPRSREEVRHAVGVVLREVVALGTSRLSRATAERLRTLAVSAHGVDLPRLERLLRTLADEVEQLLVRSARASSSGVLLAAARAEALRAGLARPLPHLVGEHRSHYEPVGGLELVGLGARAWRVGSGFAGLTVYFWDRSSRSWATWTEARPLTTGGFDPHERYRQPGPWDGVTSSDEASRTSYRLANAWKNRLGRLSGRPATRAVVIGPTGPDDLPAPTRRWTDLIEPARRLFGGGLGERAERDELVLLAPTAWGPGRFDPIRQALTRPILDESGRPLVLVLPHTPETADAVDRLEAHDPASTSSLLGLLRLDGDRLAVEPIALHDEQGVRNLTLDSGRKLPSRSTTTPAPGDEEDDELRDDDRNPPSASASGLGRLLGATLAHLESIGEGGPAAFRDLAELRGLARRLEAIGLTTCAEAVAQVVDGLDRQRRGEHPDPLAIAGDVLRALYLARLAATEESVAAAIAPLQSGPSADAEPATRERSPMISE